MPEEGLTFFWTLNASHKLRHEVEFMCIRYVILLLDGFDLWRSKALKVFDYIPLVFRGRYTLGT